MAKTQIITTESGEEMVVLARRDYDALLARAGDAAGEDAMTARIVARTAGETAIPASVWEAVEAAPSPIGPLRQWRGLTQEALAAAAGISQGYLSALERGRKTGDVHTLRAVADALGVGLDAVSP